MFQAPGCGGKGTDVYPLESTVVNTIIRVGLTPPPDAIGYATNPGQGCLDDKEGDDSVDWVFYENLYDRLNEQLCFDRNRVFSSGNSSGAWFSNELGCKYAGDGQRPIRGIMSNGGGLPTDRREAPTCTNKPMAGLWIAHANDTVHPLPPYPYPITQAMKANKCTMGTSFYEAVFEGFPIGGGNAANTCRRSSAAPRNTPSSSACLPVSARPATTASRTPGSRSSSSCSSAHSLADAALE